MQIRNWIHLFFFLSFSFFFFSFIVAKFKYLKLNYGNKARELSVSSRNGKREREREIKRAFVRRFTINILKRKMGRRYVNIGM